MADMIADMLPRHECYVEVFGGSGAVLFTKTPSKVEVYNDLDSAVINFFRCLQSWATGPELMRKLALTPFSREECYWAFDHIDDEMLEPSERARAFYILAHQSFSAKMNKSKSWGGVTTHVNEARAWMAGVDGLDKFVARLQSVMIEHYSWDKVLDIYDGPDTCFYCDPPYMPETRNGSEYRYDMVTQDHIQLLNTIRECRGMVLLSGYESDLYTELIPDWHKVELSTSATMAAKTRATGIKGPGASKDRSPRKEVLWIKPGGLVQTSLF